MAEDIPYRLALLVLFAVSGAIGAYHRRRANTGEPLARREEGFFILVSLRLLGLLLLLVTLAYLISPRLIEWAAVSLPAWIRWTGAVVGLWGLGVMAWTLRTLGRNLTDTVVTRQQHTLVVSGPYRLVRHPYYVTTLFLVTAAFLLSANALIGGVGLLVFVLLAIRSSTEEHKLIERFGDDYRDYMRRTGRFLPRLATTPTLPRADRTEHRRRS